MTVGWSTAVATILYLVSCPDVRGLPSTTASPVSLSVYRLSLTDPPLTRTPSSCGSGGSHLVFLHRDPHWEQQSFSSALTRLLAMTGSLPHRSHAHLTTPYSRHATANLQLICLLSAGAAHLTLTVWDGRLTSYLYPAHKSDFKFSTPNARLRHWESYLTLSLASQSRQSRWFDSDNLTSMTVSVWLLVT